jgi:phosphatidylinositol-3-phosphatase
LKLIRKQWVMGLVSLIFVSARTEASMQDVHTVFIIMEENNNWASISGNATAKAAAPYINNTLLPIASHAEQYYNPPGIHPSLPNYLWLEAGSNFGISNDGTPTQNHQSTTNHLVALLANAGISWTSYQESISGASCPLTASGQYAPKHNPMVYFNDVTNTNNAGSAYCIANVRPYTELAGDLQSNVVTRYNFITPNLCDDMHGNTGCPSGNLITQGDTWLANNLPTILNSQAYSNGGAIFITWDEGEPQTGESGDGPVGMIVISRMAKGGGYSNTVHYTHSSTLRTFQEIFNVTPFIRDAANAADLSDLFNPFPGVTGVTPSCGSTAGGTSITINGSNFVNGATVTIDGMAATNVVFVNSTTLTATTPAGTLGAKAVVVTNPDTQTAPLNNGFTYVGPVSFAGLANVSPAVEAATLTWAVASASPPVNYNVYEATNSGGENFASPVMITTNLSAFVSPLPLGTNCSVTYYFVVRAVDSCGNADTNTVEKPIQPLSAGPAFAGLGSATPATEGATLTWAAASGALPLTYNVFEATTSGAENYATPLLTTNSLSAFIAPLYPGSNSAITYFFVVRAVDGCVTSDTNSVELSLQPLLDPNKSQVGDGIPNGWKQQYGLNPFDPTVGSADPDGDGQSNLQEFLVGTDPTNSASAFHIISVFSTGSDVFVSWMMGVGKTNALQWTAGVGAGNYQTDNYTDIFVVTNTVGTVTNYLDSGGATNLPSRYYRVRLVP